MVVAEQGFAGFDGVAGAELSGLFGEMDVWLGGEQRADLIGAMSDDDEDGSASSLASGLDDVGDHGAAADFVEDFGGVGEHAFAVAGGEDDGDRSLHRTGLLLAWNRSWWRDLTGGLRGGSKGEAWLEGVGGDLSD